MLERAHIVGISKTEYVLATPRRLQWRHVTGVGEAVALLRTMGPGDAALVKGSRVVRLEDVVCAYAGSIPAARQP
jgi:UDP-N-acetylmuramyl pentapeptide synthase